VSGFDVVVLGEVLLEVSTDAPLAAGVGARLGVSGDALNAAAAAAAAGARVALLSVLAEDDSARAIRDRVAGLGISTDLLTTGRGQQGVYLTHADPSGERQFVYSRSGSVGSTLSPAMLPEEELARAGLVLASGITCAISPSARAAVHRVSELVPGRLVYDPNHRPRLRGSDEALADLLALAPSCALVTPSHPAETGLFAGNPDPAGVAAELLARGARAVAVTCGASGLRFDGPASGWLDAVPAPRLVDQTGAGDALVGSAAGRLALGDDLETALRHGVAAASLAVGGPGGTGFVASREQVLDHLAAHSAGVPG